MAQAVGIFLWLGGRTPGKNPGASQSDLTLTVTYRDQLASAAGGFTAQQLLDSPDRRLQIHQITDSRSDVATFHYKSTQESGRWVVEQIVLPDGSDVDYGYTGGQLSTITYHDGSVASFVYGQDTEAQTATVDVYTLSNPSSVRLHLTNDYMLLDNAGQAQVINQPNGIFRMSQNAAGEIKSMLVADPTVANKFTLYQGTGQAVEIIPGQSARNWEDGWVVSTSGAPPGAIEEELTETVSIAGSQEVTYQSIASGTTVADLYRNTIPGMTDETGREFSFEYDADGFRTKKTFVADGTYEQYTYNSFKQLTRLRDRQGNVTLSEYDAQGNRTKVKQGLKEVNESPGAIRKRWLAS